MTKPVKKSVFSAYGHECSIGAEADVVGKIYPGNSFLSKYNRFWARLVIVSVNCNVYTPNLRSYGSFLKEQERQLTHHPYRIHPQSILRLGWEIFISILILLNMILHALDLPYLYTSSTFVHSITWNVVRFSVEAMLLNNVFLGLFTGYYDTTKQEVVFDFKSIMKNKWKSCLIFLVAILPYQLLEPVFSGYKESFIMLLYLLKLMLLYTFNNYYKRIIEYYKIRHHIYLKTIIFIYLIIYIHLLSCYLSFVKKTRNKHHLGNLDPNSFYLYVSGIYDASTVLYTAGYGKLFPTDDLEHFFISVCWYMSRLFFIFVLACFMESIKVSTSSKSRYLALEHELKEYMRHKQLPSHMRKRISTYYEFRFQKRYFREEEILKTISAQLKQEINMHACKKLVENVVFFRNLPINLLVKIISCLQIQIFLPNDIIIRANTQGKCMYFISTGTVAVYTKSGKEICHLKDGDHFGEVALVYQDTLRIATVIAIEISEIYTLDKKDFVKAIYPYPDLLANILNIAADRMETAHMLDEHNKTELAQKSNSAL